MRFQKNPLRIRSALAAVFVSPAKPRSRPPRLLACHNYSSQSFGASSILLFKAAGTLIYASKIAPCPRPGPIAHGTFPIRWATSGVDFVQPSSRSPRSPQSEITLWAAETYSTRGLILVEANNVPCGWKLILRDFLGDILRPLVTPLPPLDDNIAGCPLKKKSPKVVLAW